jgi:hypothetical protein
MLLRLVVDNANALEITGMVSKPFCTVQRGLIMLTYETTSRGLKFGDEYKKGSGGLR